jgi:integrase
MVTSRPPDQEPLGFFFRSEAQRPPVRRDPVLAKWRNAATLRWSRPAWDSCREQRDGITELAEARWLSTRLGRQCRHGSFPEAGGQLSTTAVIRIVRPIMLAAGVPAQQAHPHTLRHTFGRLYMSARGAELSRLQRIMGHTSPETTSRYVFHQDLELAAEHRRIERLQSDPLARRQDHRRTRAAGRGSSSMSRD